MLCQSSIQMTRDQLKHLPLRECTPGCEAEKLALYRCRRDNFETVNATSQFAQGLPKVRCVFFALGSEQCPAEVRARETPEYFTVYTQACAVTT